MIIDFHVHAFPCDIRENREVYFLGEQEFKLLYENTNQKLVGASDIIKMMDIHKIKLSVIFGFPWNNDNICRMNNDYILQVVSQYPDRFRGFCCVNPFSNDAVKEVKRCLSAGLSGVGELAFYDKGLDKNCRSVLTSIMDICKDKDVPVLLHVNEEIGHYYPGKTSNTMKQVYNTIKCFPKNKIVLAHWGGGLFFFNLLKKETSEVLHNTYYDISASPFLYKDKIYKISKEIMGVDKFLFGTDYPLLKPNRYLEGMIKANLNQEDIDKICFENASRLLKL